MAHSVPLLEPARCEEIASLVESLRDILDERVNRPVPPCWATARGWDRFLLGLSDAELEECEVEGLAPALARREAVPESLEALAATVAAATVVPSMDAGGAPADGAPPKHLSPRKSVQVSLLIEALGGLHDRVERVVDIGAGAGHLTRIANAAWRVPTLGLEVEGRLVERARLLAAEQDGEGVAEARFVHFDAFSRPIDLLPTDLAVGLHACGALADVIVVAAARARCPVAIVACCHQKRPEPVREPLSEMGRRHGMRFTLKTLGLANLHPRAARLGPALADAMDARTGRYALCLLLESRGIRVSEEMTLRPPKGHRIYRGFAAMARAEFQKRGLEPPADEEILRCLDRARSERATIRRLSLPRNVLGRLLEIGLAADRAAFLMERGFSVRLAEVFPDAASPRNLLLLGEP